MALPSLKNMLNMALPTADVNVPTPTYSSSYNQSTPFGKLLEQMGKYLAPQKAFTQDMPYADFAKPYQEIANQYVESTVKPWFQQNTLNPYKRATANQMAVSGGNLMGNTNRRLTDSFNQLYSEKYYPQVNQVQNTLEDYARQFYNQLGGQNYNSPIAFRKV